MKYIIIGVGSRGTIYGNWAHTHGIEIAALSDIRPDRLKKAAADLALIVAMGAGLAVLLQLAIRCL